MTVLLLLVLTALMSGGSVVQRPDFSGSWKFDRTKSLQQPGPDGRVVLAAMLGEEFDARQDTSTLRLTIKAGGQTVTATYKLDGTESLNMSPGDIPVTSRAGWEGDTLVISSRSRAEEKGVVVTIQTRRVLWLDKSGDLIIERTGTPAASVTPSRSVYSKVR